MKIEIVNITPQFAPKLRELQLICFPSTDPDELFYEEDLVAYAETFPQGNFVALADGEVVGLGAGGFYSVDFDNLSESMHVPMHGRASAWHTDDGAYYYGTDISVHPGYRRYGIGTRLYEARKSVVRQFGKKGIIAGGFIPGFADYKDQMSVQTYVDKVVSGELYDPTLSFQLRHGFRVAGLLENYMNVANSDGWATLIIWDNPDLNTPY